MRIKRIIQQLIFISSCLLMIFTLTMNFSSHATSCEKKKQCATKSNVGSNIGNAACNVSDSCTRTKQSLKCIKPYYMLPSWPVQATFFDQNDMFKTEFYYNWASGAENTHGRTQNITRLVFGKDCLRVKDILLASKLLKEEKVNAATVGASTDGDTFQERSKKHFLYQLADQVLDFDGDAQRQELRFTYLRRFNAPSMTFGVHVPIVRQYQELCLRSSLSPQLQESLRDSQAGGFFSSYTTLEDFIVDVLKRKNMELTQSSEYVGLGDIQLFGHIAIESCTAEKLLLGINLTLPTARMRNNNTLWAAEGGNGGFAELSIFGSALFNMHKFFNPYGYVQITASPGSSVDRRVPRILSYDATTNDPVPPKQKVPADFLVMGEQIQFLNSFTEQRDASARRFATKIRRVKIRRGTQFFGRLGNIFSHVPGNHGTIELFYDLHAKTNDYARKSLECAEFDRRILVQDSYTVAHRIGGKYAYQFDKTTRLYTEFMYTFAGRNVYKVYEGNLGINVQF